MADTLNNNATNATLSNPDSTPRWYIVHTYSGYENKVAETIKKVVDNRGLQKFIYEVLVPTETVEEETDGKKRVVERKIYPSYVLVKMICNDETWYVIRNIRGATGFVGPGSKPTPLSDEEVERLAQSLGVENQPKIETNIKVGDEVQVVGTAMDGFIGTVQSVDVENDTCDILVSMFGRETPATVKLTQVQKTDL